MWVKIRNIIVPVILNETTLKAFATGCGMKEDAATNVAGAIMDIKYFVDTRDKRYINQCIDKLQTLIKQEAILSRNSLVVKLHRVVSKWYHPFTLYV